MKYRRNVLREAVESLRVGIHARRFHSPKSWVVPQRGERREQEKEKGKKEKEERGGGKSKARIGETEDHRKKVHV